MVKLGFQSISFPSSKSNSLSIHLITLVKLTRFSICKSCLFIHTHPCWKIIHILNQRPFSLCVLLGSIHKHADTPTSLEIVQAGWHWTQLFGVGLRSEGKGSPDKKRAFPDVLLWIASSPGCHTRFRKEPAVMRRAHGPLAGSGPVPMDATSLWDKAGHTYSQQMCASCFVP